MIFICLSLLFDFVVGFWRRFFFERVIVFLCIFLDFFKIFNGEFFVSLMFLVLFFCFASVEFIFVLELLTLLIFLEIFIGWFFEFWLLFLGFWVGVTVVLVLRFGILFVLSSVFCEFWFWVIIVLLRDLIFVELIKLLEVLFLFEFFFFVFLFLLRVFLLFIVWEFCEYFGLVILILFSGIIFFEYSLENGLDCMVNFFL